MGLKISGGAQENGIVFGNAYDKYGSTNPLVRWMMSGFESTLFDLAAIASPKTIHEVGCGEGYWVLTWAEQGLTVRGCDVSQQVVAIAQENASERGLSPDLFKVTSIYDLDPLRDRADLVVCCEVLEHLDHPDDGLKALQSIVGEFLVVSVPREPLWRTLNMARGKYLSELGNTPGHIQHWSKQGFVRLVSKYFQVVEVRSPLPWVMLLCQPF
jgi:2-polyprenyl-3-methyl-5-hydroxy-6-metoxy-1,4-benzoquinol methylase